MNYPKYYRKDGRCIKCKSPTTGTEVRTPDDVRQKLPLSMSEVTYPTPERFTQELATMEEVDQACFEDYVYAFIRGVHINVEQPMSELQLQRQLKQNEHLNQKV
jgi:hypothetical protein